MRHDRSHRKLMNYTEGPKSTRGEYRVMGRPEDTAEYTGAADCNAHVTAA